MEGLGIPASEPARREGEACTLAARIDGLHREIALLREALDSLGQAAVTRAGDNEGCRTATQIDLLVTKYLKLRAWKPDD